MDNILSNSVNKLICPHHYHFDHELAVRFAINLECFEEVDLPHIESRTSEVLVKHRHRNQQTVQLLNKLGSALIPCTYVDWLERRSVDPGDAYSIDFSLLSEQDFLDLYLMPDDHILDRFGDRYIEGPAFLDYRDGGLVGVCVRNITEDKEYAAAAKYTFSNFGWFLFGYDLYDRSDEIFLVEGVFDALAMRSFDYNAIALGSAYPTVFQLACLASKFNKFNVCFDNDFWGHVGGYAISRILGAKMFIPKLKDVSYYREKGGPIELDCPSLKEVKQMLTREIDEYNRLVTSGAGLSRSLPYN